MGYIGRRGSGTRSIGMGKFVFFHFRFGREHSCGYRVDGDEEAGCSNLRDLS
jgi:hypothetical protein